MQAIKHVLAVDDEAAILRTIERNLSSETIEISLASNVSDAHTCISKFSGFSLIFIDVNLGERQEDGVALLKNLRHIGYSAPVCMLTGDDDIETIYRCLLAGANDYIWKGSSNPTANDCMRASINNLENTKCSYEDAIKNSNILKNKGLCQSQCELLSAFTTNGFPDIVELSDILNISENALVKRFSRIEKQLQLKNRSALVRLLTILSGFYV